MGSFDEEQDADDNSGSIDYDACFFSPRVSSLRDMAPSCTSPGISKRSCSKVMNSPTTKMDDTMDNGCLEETNLDDSYARGGCISPDNAWKIYQNESKERDVILYSLRKTRDKKAAEVQIAVDCVTYTIDEGDPILPCVSRRKSRDVLKDISGIHEAGRLLAILGPSGAGKTTFLNMLGGKMRPTSGHIRLNGEPASPTQITEISAFVHQDDCMLATMTVSETILFAAHLRLPYSMSNQKKRLRAGNAIRLLGLEKCKNTIIGSTINGTRGVSGGERKRCAIATELLTNPSIVFLDEPSSGLDAFAAYSLGTVLKTLCHLGKTIAMTIHQPSSDLYELFDDMLLLANGRTVYWGPSSQSVQYFSQLGHNCPQFCNPCDYFFLHVLNAAGNTSSNDKVARLHDIWQSSSLQMDLEDGFSTRMKRNGIDSIVASRQKATVPAVCKIAMLTNRGYKNFLRNRMLLPSRLIQALISAAVGIAVFWDITENQTGIMARSGVLFYFAANTLFSSVLCVLSAFSSERPVFMREYANGAYSVGAYFCSKILVEYPFQILTPIVVALSSYWAIGLQSSLSKFSIFAVTIVMINLCGSNIGLALSSAFRDISIALSLAPLFVLPLMLFSGFFISYEDTPLYVAWIQAISPVRYAFAILMQNEFSGLELHCTPSQMLKAPGGLEVCPIQDGSTYIKLYSYDTLDIRQCFVALFILFMATFLMSFLTLYVTAAKSKGSLRFNLKK
eukprot:CAMPEP_0198240856 /NCGR_PEP_ID=MMETSP1446-20131203/5847_1 /TAXON_ID=1461542 ORGANISM="Unidentified sp, Strain CCMP2111" /NCGR_SAMPLE_ID=MMETSP1446 /ASSEMBLY_ACC=CAM_ASM_001112 /LENGTH=732 /DNA_ID=CAMNT_0043923635 /DNA_START=336 /DNA_END=2534 /DNA_ORIENTATION=-